MILFMILGCVWGLGEAEEDKCYLDLVGERFEIMF